MAPRPQIAISHFQTPDLPFDRLVNVQIQVLADTTGHLPFIKVQLISSWSISRRIITKHIEWTRILDTERLCLAMYFLWTFMTSCDSRSLVCHELALCPLTTVFLVFSFSECHINADNHIFCKVVVSQVLPHDITLQTQDVITEWWQGAFAFLSVFTSL